MREIKFRAWDGETRTMLHSGIAIEISGVQSRNVMKDVALVFMQFTGLRDKNGKEIYEGDIVSNTKMHSKVVVEFQVRDGSASIFPYKMHEAWEVIGNIYENPELLK